MNLCIFTGRIVRKPELETFSDYSRALVSIAVRRDYKNKDGHYDADFVDAIAWKQNAEYLTKYAEKGCLVELCCSWRTGPYEKDGQKKTHRSFTCKQIRILSYPQNHEAASEEIPAPTDDDLGEYCFDFGDLPF